MFFADVSIDRQNAVKPFVVIKAHRSQYSGWMMAVHKNYRKKSEAMEEAEVVRQACPYVRIEHWPNRDGGETVVSEFGTNPGKV